MKMITSSRGQLLIVAIVAIVAAACFFFHADWRISGLSALFVILYLCIIFFLAANRVKGLLPNLGHSIWIFLSLFLIVLFSFGNMYIKTCEIVDSNVSSKKEYSTEVVNECDRSGVLRDNTDAIYYSLVTLTTTGYGDYVPMGQWGRKIVIYQLVASALLIAGGLTFMISRLAGFDGDGEKSSSKANENLKEILEKRTIRLKKDNSPVFFNAANNGYEVFQNGVLTRLDDNEKLDEAKKELEKRKEQNTVTTKDIDELVVYLKNIGKKLD